MSDDITCSLCSQEFDFALGHHCRTMVGGHALVVEVSRQELQKLYPAEIKKREPSFLGGLDALLRHCREKMEELDKQTGATEWEDGDLRGQFQAYADIGEALHDLLRAAHRP